MFIAKETLRHAAGRAGGVLLITGLDACDWLLPVLSVQFKNRTADRANLTSEARNSTNRGARAQMRHHRKQRGHTLNAKNPVLRISVFVIALFAGLSVTQAQTKAIADVVTAISNLENDAVKADLAGDPAFYQKVLAEDWTRGDSDGTYFTKAILLNLMADTKNIKTNSEKISELKVRVYGNMAVATYKDTYDLLIRGEHRAHTVIATDTFVKIDGEWKQVASHGSEAK
jgi:hypothetical protein